MSEISLRAIERILKKSGAKRISENACKELQKYLEKKGLEIGKRSAKFMKHAKRRTLMKQDIELSINE